MFSPSSTHPTTIRHVELIDHELWPGLQNTLRSHATKVLHIYSKVCIISFFIFKIGDEVEICLVILVLYIPWCSSDTGTFTLYVIFSEELLSYGDLSNIHTSLPSMYQ